LGSSSFEINIPPLQRQPQPQSKSNMQPVLPDLSDLQQYWPQNSGGGQQAAYYNYGPGDERWKTQGLDKKGRMIGYKHFEKVNPNMAWGAQFPAGNCAPDWAIVRRRGKANYQRTLNIKYGGDRNKTPLAQIMRLARPEYARIKAGFAAADQLPPTGTWGAVLKKYGTMYKAQKAQRGPLAPQQNPLGGPIGSPSPSPSFV